MVDALRFEMAQSLADDLKRDKYRTDLAQALQRCQTSLESWWKDSE